MSQGHCIETVASDGFIAECFFTYVFGDGSLTANGPFNFNATSGVLPSVLAVTGGTGNYTATQGEVGTQGYTHALIESCWVLMRKRLPRNILSVGVRVEVTSFILTWTRGSTSRTLFLI